jgi:hypothetical protein
VHILSRIHAVVSVAMRTLFGASIYSPSSAPEAVHQTNPLQLRFTSSRAATTSSSHTSSTPSSHGEDIWLTDSHQGQRRIAVQSSASVNHEAESRTWRNGDASQKGVPKVLLMGLGRYVYIRCRSAILMARVADHKHDTGVESPLSSMSS